MSFTLRQFTEKVAWWCNNVSICAC